MTLVLAGFAGAGASYAHYYTDELAVGNSIEAHGIYYNRHINIDTSACTGLRRYGVHSSAYGLDKFWRFSCDADGANGHIYTVQVSTTYTARSGYWAWHQLSVKFLF